MGGKTGCDRFKGKNDEIVGEIERIGYKNRHFLMGLVDLKEEGIWRLEYTSEKTNYTNWHNSEPTTMAARTTISRHSATNYFNDGGNYMCDYMANRMRTGKRN